MPKTTGEPFAGFGVPRTALALAPEPWPVPAELAADVVAALEAVLLFELELELPHAASPPAASTPALTRAPSFLNSEFISSLSVPLVPPRSPAPRGSPLQVPAIGERGATLHS
jgi:hypothetical protein